MVAAAGELPSDLSELKAFTLSLQAELHAKTLQIEALKAKLAALRRARFGRSSEKLDREIEQLELLIEDIGDGSAAPGDTTPQADAEEKPEPARPSVSKPRPKGRGKLPSHLEREVVEHPAPCRCPACGGGKLSRIGTDAREVLEYVPSHFKVIVHQRPKVSCRSCETITQAPMPGLPIERGLAGPGLLAHMAVSKYADHMPFYRQSGIYARAGVTIERSTMADWTRSLAFLLEPLAELIGDHVRAGPSLHADDTPVPVLDPGRGKTKTGRLWVAVRDERPWGSAIPPAVYYRYAPDRRAERVEALLGGCRGYLHADGYAGFNKLYRRHRSDGDPPLREVACWAHARRYIYEVHAQTGSAAAEGLLKAIGRLFAVEDQIRGADPAQRRAARTSQAVPLLRELKARYEATLMQVSAKSSLGKALRYALSRWNALSRYTEDGRLEICNNAAERAIRPLALGRKNWLFAGSDGGGERAAIMYTLIQTARMNGLDPESYLREVMSRIADYPIKRLDDLTPWNIGTSIH